jgi:hypothetical protein
MARRPVMDVAEVEGAVGKNEDTGKGNVWKAFKKGPYDGKFTFLIQAERWFDARKLFMTVTGLGPEEITVSMVSLDHGFARVKEAAPHVRCFETRFVGLGSRGDLHMEWREWGTDEWQE